MNEKLHLFSVGNLYTGFPFGVETEAYFGEKELHGPFGTQNEAERYAHKLNGEYDDYLIIKVVRIETPQVGRSIRDRSNHSTKV